MGNGKYLCAPPINAEGHDSLYFAADCIKLNRLAYPVVDGLMSNNVINNYKQTRS